MSESNGNETKESPALATDTRELDKWDTATLAKLVNFDDRPEIPSPIVVDEDVKRVNSPTGNAVPQSELFDDPIEGKTQPSFHKRGINKAAATGGVLLVVFALVGAFLNSVFNSSPRRIPSIASSPTPVATPTATPTPGTETGNLKTEVALGKQADQIKAIDGSKSPKTQLAKKTQQSGLPASSSIPTRTTQAPSNSSFPRTYSLPKRQYSPPPSPSHTASYPAAVRPQLVSAPFLATSNSVNPLPQEQAQKAEKVDPMQQWMTMNRIGSYGTSNVGSQVPPEPESASGMPTSPSEQVQINQAEEASILKGTPVRQLTVGDRAPGQLLTPVIWAGAALPANQTGTAEKFIVQLAQPLTDKDGSVILPQGTQIVATVVGVNESGLAQLEATQAIVDSLEYVLPPGAVDIRGNDGQPLIASLWGDKGKASAQGDVSAFLLNSLSRVGQVLTQSDSESSTSMGGYGYSSTTASRRGGRNVLGAVLDGGFTPLAQQILKRNEQRLKEMTSRPDVWYVRAGENVQVFVNRSFEL